MLLPHNDVGRSENTTFPWDSVQQWHQRPKQVYGCPTDLIKKYLPLCSKPFQCLCQQKLDADDTHLHEFIGILGLNLALDSQYTCTVGVEASALLQLLSDMKVIEKAALPNWNHINWNPYHIFTVCNTATHWRGCISEYRLFCCILCKEKKECAVTSQYPVPVIRSWVCDEVIADIYSCLTKDFVIQLSEMVALSGFNGTPDLFLWTNGSCRFVEVKSNDKLRMEQKMMMNKLKSLAQVSVCCPEHAMKCFKAFADDVDTDDEI